MQQHQTMSLDEKLAIGCKAAELRAAGDAEGASRLLRTAPLPPYIAKVMKEKVGMEFCNRSRIYLPIWFTYSIITMIWEKKTNE